MRNCSELLAAFCWLELSGCICLPFWRLAQKVGVLREPDALEQPVKSAYSSTCEGMTSRSAVPTKLELFRDNLGTFQDDVLWYTRGCEDIGALALERGGFDG